MNRLTYFQINWLLLFFIPVVLAILDNRMLIFTLGFLIFEIWRTWSHFYGGEWVPTPQNIIDKMLKIANVKKNDIVYDLGSGDGKIVLSAAKLGSRVVGIEIDPLRVLISKMKILVAISNVPDTTTKITFGENNSKFNSAGVQFIINPYDEWYALVRALELKEAGKAEKITIIHVGLPESDATIRKGFALGADDGVRIDAEGPDAYFVAEQISAYAKTNNYDLIMAGKETISYNGSSVGGMIAGFLDLPYVSLATKFELNGNTATVEHDIDGGTQVIECELPLVISCAKGMAEQRIPNMKGIMSARTKPLTVVPAIATEKLSSIKSFELSAGRTTCKMIDENNLDELVNLLHTQAKVI